jgi:SNF2 family DNA or RNA helicase
MPSLHPHQNDEVAHLAAHSFAVLADPMGAGKTAGAIRAADAVGARKILDIVPAIARIAWQREFVRWQEIDRSIQRVNSYKDIADGLTADVNILSYSLMATPRVLAILRQYHYDLVIFDECQALKTPDTKRTLGVYSRSGLIGCTKRLWLLSGPAPNHAGELWTHLRASRLTTLDYWTFVRRYCRVRESQFGLQIIGSNRTMMPELADILRPILLRREMVDLLPN